MASNGSLILTDGSLVLPFTCNTPAIYAIVNRDNLKMYIGSALNPRDRLRGHRYDLRNQKHHSQYFQRAFFRSPESFYVEILEHVSKETIIGREQFWLDFFKSYLPANGYNVLPKAQSSQGARVSLETRRKMSMSRRGRKFSEESKRRMSEAQRNRPKKELSESQRIKFRLAHIGHKCSESQKEKARQWHVANGSPVAVPVRQFKTNGTFIMEFRSAYDAAREFSTVHANIQQVCDGKRRQAKGFMWRKSDGSAPTNIEPMRPVKLSEHRNDLRGRRKQWLIKICHQCEKTFEVPPHMAVQKNCSLKCTGLSNRKALHGKRG